jgi:hypothetical protein
VVEGIHFLNTGSVGRPKDGDWRAGYVVVSVAEGAGGAATPSGGSGGRAGAASGPDGGNDAGTDGGLISVEFIRVEYDLERARAGILASALPDAFAEYLATGGKPRSIGAPTGG